MIEVTWLADEVSYRFKIVAYDDVPTMSPFSNKVSMVVPDGTAPRPPENVDVYYTTSTSIHLDWYSSPDHDVRGYNVYRANSPTGTFLKINDALANYGYDDEGLKEAREGRYKIAMELYDQALMNYPTYAEAWAWKAAAYAQLNKFQDALDCAEQAIAADPCYEWGYFRKARTLESMGEAMAAYRRANELDPSYLTATANLARLEQIVAPIPEEQVAPQAAPPVLVAAGEIAAPAPDEPEDSSASVE